MAPLSHNGYITHYNIDVRNNKGNMLLNPFYNFVISAVNGQQYYSLLVTNLSMSNRLYSITENNIFPLQLQEYHIM